MKSILARIRASLSIQAAILVTVFVICISFFYSYHHYREMKVDLFKNTEMQLLRIVEGLKKPIEMFVMTKDYHSLQTLVSDTSNGADIELITVLDSSGMVLASNKLKWIGKGMDEMHPEDETEEDLAAIRNALDGGYSIYYDKGDDQHCLAIPLDFGLKGRGALHISLDRQTMQAQIRKRTTDILLLSLFISIIGGAGLYFIFHIFFTKRVKAVSDAALRLARGDMQARVVDSGSDEIGYLATSFNVLAEDITNWRTNLEEMVTQKVKDLQVLYEVAHSISQSLDLNTVLQKVLDLVLDTFSLPKGFVAMLGDEGDTLRLIGQKGLSFDGIRRISRLKMGNGIISRAILGNRPVRFTLEDAEEADASCLMAQEGMDSVLAVPIGTRGTAFGVIAVYSNKKGGFTEEEEALLATIGNQAAVAVENARLYEKTLELAREDGLTGLANRRHLMEILLREVSRSNRYETPLSLLMIDLDRFKRFNDTYGHVKGDELLKAFADLIMGNIRSTDTAGRYGGEEFMIILANTPLKGAIVIAERIRKAVENIRLPIADDRPPAGATVSIGIAELASGETPEKLIEAADAALYRAKEAGRNRLAW